MTMNDFSMNCSTSAIPSRRHGPSAFITIICNDGVNADTAQMTYLLHTAKRTRLAGNCTRNPARARRGRTATSAGGGLHRPDGGTGNRDAGSCRMTTGSSMPETSKRHAHQSTRIGVAPYIGHYGDLHTWLMLQTDYYTNEDKHFPGRRWCGCSRATIWRRSASTCAAASCSITCTHVLGVHHHEKILDFDAGSIVSVRSGFRGAAARLPDITMKVSGLVCDFCARAIEKVFMK